ncbi:MAG: Sensor histidine kinase RcsC [Anaerolineae bacterium]|nr:Sensor histidine kinase RcsC [Anaerolineae bacterium]
MKPAPLPANEAQRLAMLHALKILDTPPEDRFDRITRLAQKLLNVPIVLISLVDTERQWFKSRQGLAAPETSREVSFCAHAILDYPQPLVVADTGQDDRFRDNPLVTGEPHIRFYAGQPVAAPDGSPLGTLCVIDRQSRQFGPQELALLKDLAALAENEINLIYLADRQQESSQALKEESARASSQARFTGLLLDNLPVGVVVVNPNGVITRANQAIVDVFGYSLEELVNKSFREFSLPHRREADSQYFQEALAGQQSGWHETEVLHRDGRPVPVRVFNTLLKDEAGAAIGLLASVEDLTERKQVEATLQASERRFRAIFDHTFQFIGLLEPDGTVLEANRSALEFGGLQLADIAQRPFWETRWWSLSAETRAELKAAIVRAAAGEFVRYQTQVVGGEDQVITVDFSLKPVFNDRGEVILLVPEGRDITEQKRAEQEIRALNNELEQRVAARTQELSAANADLAQANRLKDEFLAAMSHELRTPLNAVLGLSESLVDGILGELNPEQLEAVEEIAESGQHLLALIGDILDLSKIQAGQLDLKLEPVLVDAVCRASLRLVLPEARHKNLKVVTTFDNSVVEITADERHLKQMLVNLLSNAVKFTPAGGRVGLEVIGDETGQVVRVTVWDTGIGIAAKDLERLFQPFVQIDSRLSRQFDGTGLGLALVQRLAHLHSGSVQVQSEPGRGSRFTIVLPWAKNSVREAAKNDR